MTADEAASAAIDSKLSRLGFGANFLGAIVTFLYLTVIDPIPAGEASVRSLEPLDIAVFALAVIVIFSGATLLSNRLQRPMRDWQRRLDAGGSQPDIPSDVARRVLNWPLIASAIVAATWLVAAIFFSLLYDNPSNFVGIATGGAVTTAIVFSGTDLLWRRLVPGFFPQGNISAVPAFRLWVQRRLLLAFALIGLVTPILLVVLTLTRRRALIDAANPQTVLDNLIIAQLFVVSMGIAAGVVVAVLVARAVVDPLQELQAGMERVQNNDLDTRVTVSTNDELGFLSERFNQMTAGLRQGARLRQLFGLYVSPEVARAAVETGAGLGGELVECTVMFSDIRDFTTLTEQLDPQELVDLINRYMTLMVSVIVKHGGVVTRFGGDSILAVFGTPLNPIENHAMRAIAAAVQMRSALASFNQTEPAGGQSRLEAGVGIATGPVIAGNVGGKERIEYTVMGDAANVAARLEDMTKELGFPILLSDTTYLALDERPGLTIRELNDVRIKGKQGTTTVYGLYA